MQRAVYSSLNFDLKNIYCLSDASHTNEIINLQIIQVFSLILTDDYMAESVMSSIIIC